MTYKEFTEKYGEVEVTFSSYYKFKFMFKGIVDNSIPFKVWVGDGNSDCIYKEKIDTFPITVNMLCPDEFKIGNSPIEEIV